MRFKTDRRGKNKFKWTDGVGYGFKLKRAYLQHRIQFNIYQYSGTELGKKRYAAYKGQGHCIIYGKPKHLTSRKQ